MSRILVIDDDTYICDLLVNYLKQHNHEVQGVFSGKNGMKALETSSYDLVLCDYRLPDSDGYEILNFVRSSKSVVPVIIMTAYAEIKIAVKLIKSGAFDYVTKPIQPEEILQLVKKALNSKKEKETSSSFENKFITGGSEKIQKVMQHVQAVAPTDLRVLIEGETGSGKEFIARAIHHFSERSKKPFVAVDCGAIPKELANSELFGHIKGAFTGAINDKKGVFEQAKGGTLFLDEVGNLPHENQVKLLRALQESKISRVGDNKSIKVDVRILTASNDDLRQKVNDKEFREDLFHRLNGFKIQLPPLRERGEDIFEFVSFFIKEANESFNKNVTDIDDKVRELILTYPWPGNIRELLNVINRAVLLIQGNLLTLDVFPEEIRLADLSEENNVTVTGKKQVTELKQATHNKEKEIITKALIKTNFNKSKAARLLNIDRKTLYNKIKLYDIPLS